MFLKLGLSHRFFVFLYNFLKIEKIDGMIFKIDDK